MPQKPQVKIELPEICALFDLDLFGVGYDFSQNRWVVQKEGENPVASFANEFEAVEDRDVRNYKLIVATWLRGKISQDFPPPKDVQDFINREAKRLREEAHAT